MTKFKPRTETRDDPSASHAGYLYHKQDPESRPRHSGRSSKLPSRKKPSANAAHEAFLANVKTFSIVATCMALTLFLAMHVQRKSWQLKQERSARTTPSANSASTVAPDLVEQIKRDQRSAGDTAALDTEAMREAVLLTRKGTALQEDGEAEKAIAAYREALEHWPYLTEAWSKLGRLYLQRGDYNRAHRAMERAAESDPSSAELLNDLGVVYLHQGRVEKATTVFNTALDLDPEFSLSYFNLALCYLAENKRDKARDYMDRYLTIHPNDARALRETAFLDAAEGRYDQALTVIEKAIASSPEWPPLYFDAAASAALMGNANNALDYLKEALALSPAAVVLRIFQQPAFSDVRQSDAGKQFIDSLTEQMREKKEVRETAEMKGHKSEPLSSVSSPL